MNRSIDAVLFDKDGTLIDFEASWGGILSQAATWAAAKDDSLAMALLKAGGFDPMTGRFSGSGIFAMGDNHDIARLWVAAGSPYSEAQIAAHLNILCLDQGPQSAVPAGDLLRLLGHLCDSGLTLGVATMDSEASARATLTHLGIADYLAFIAGYDSGYGVKPGPGMVLAFSRLTGIPLPRIAVVGDTVYDVHMARAARVGLMVGVTGPRGNPDLVSLADITVSSIESVADLFPVAVAARV